MINTYEFGTENQARAFWHHLLDQMGFDRFADRCSIALVGGVYVITVRHD